jgi:hypothetical protein
MTYKQLKELKPEAFKRRCGLQMETFDRMVEILNPHLDRRGKRGGQCKLSVEDQLLIVLEYWRELRIVVEHVNRRLKIFRILAERYRNRRKRFGLRFNLISAILNFELASPS